MAGPDGEELLGLAEAIVSKALRHRATEAEVYMEAAASVDVDVEGGHLAGLSRSHHRGAAVRVVQDGHVGFAYFADPDSADDAIDAALRMCRHAPRTGYRLPGGGTVDPLGGRWDDGLAALDAAEAVGAATTMLDAAKAAAQDASAELNMVGGGAGASWSLQAIASSRGVAAWDRSTYAHAAASLATPDGEGQVNAWDAVGDHVAWPDAEALTGAVADTVLSLRGGKEASSGTADIILLPDAAADLLQSGVLPALDGDTAKRGKSVWSGQRGKTVAHAGLTLADDPLAANGLGTTPMDGEGLPTHRQALIEAGVLRLFLFDSWDAFRHGETGTHHAVRGGFKAPPTTGPHHLTITHRVHEPQDRLVGGVDDGYLVESLLGAHTANATTGDFSVTAPNVWRIENGAVVGPSQAVAVAGNLPRLLSGLDAVSDAPKRLDGALVPAIRLRDVAVSA